MQPASAAEEAALWYQYYFHTERGYNGLEKNRREIAQLLWKMWSPTWEFDDQTFSNSADSFDNPDFVDVVIHSYRHRYGLAEGDPQVGEIESLLALQPDITIPSIAIDGDVNGIISGTSHHAKKFTGPYEYRVFKNTGHNLPQEQPLLWVQAIVDAKNLSAS